MYPWRCKTCGKINYTESPINPPEKCCGEKDEFDRLAKICLLVPCGDDEEAVHVSKQNLEFGTLPGKRYKVACGAKNFPQNASDLRIACTCKGCLEATEPQPVEQTPPPENDGEGNQDLERSEIDDESLPSNVELTIENDEPNNPFQGGD